MSNSAYREGPRLLLTAPFKPYGVRTRWAEADGMQMELWNNQITREQGVHSMRANFWTFPLYFLAENISVPTTVMDFPSWRAFVRELRKGYTHVGISFIQTNVLKVKRMAEFIRKRFPGVKILLGGHGTMLPDLDRLVPHDSACRGEGIRWLRRYFGEEPGAPIRHPLLHGVARKIVYGFRTRTDDSSILFPGLGCTNRCFFCSTSSLYGGQYVPVLSTGRSMFELCRRIEDTFGIREFAVIDENFLFDPERATELLALMERHGKTYNFAIFSSAQSIRRVGVEFLVRLGVCAVWMGIETQADVFEKLRGIDTRALVNRLQANGISVISSSILFMEHHDADGLNRDIDWAIGHGSDMHQFMQLTPLPGTPLFAHYTAQGRMIANFPYAKMSGQQVLNFAHPHFRSEEARELTRAAFRRKYDRDGPGIINMARTALWGYVRAERNAARRRRLGLGWDAYARSYEPAGEAPVDSYMARRTAMLRRRAAEFRPLLWSAYVFAPNRRTRRKCARLIAAHRRYLGRWSSGDTARSLLLLTTAALEALRIAARRVCGRGELVRQPPTRRMEYRKQEHGPRDSTWNGKERKSRDRGCGHAGRKPSLVAEHAGGLGLTAVRALAAERAAPGRRAGRRRLDGWRRVGRRLLCAVRAGLAFAARDRGAHDRRVGVAAGRLYRDRPGPAAR